MLMWSLVLLVPAVLLCGIVFLYFFFHCRGIYRDIVDAGRRSDYAAQLSLAEGLRFRGSEPAMYLFWRGSALYQLGQTGEAEQALRRSLATLKTRKPRLGCGNLLGRVLMAQSRWDEAAHYFAQCISEFPLECVGHLSMAELLLRRGEQAESALEEARKAEEAELLQRVAPFSLARELHEAQLARCLAVQAWALARTGGDPGKVAAMLQEAFDLCGTKANHVVAEMHYFAGRTCGELGNAAESDGHFRDAIAADGAGNFGRLSAAALAAGVR